MQPVTLRDASVVTQLEAFAAELMIVAAYGLILPQNVLDVPVQGCLNVHASVLPRWRGAAPIQAAILAGDDSNQREPDGDDGRAGLRPCISH